MLQTATPPTALPEGRPASECMAAAAAGDQRAFQELYQRFSRPVYNLVLRSVRDPHAAEDVCQEIWVRAYRALPGLNDAAAFPAWLYRTASRVCVDVARKRARLARETSLPEIASDNRTDPETAALTRDRTRLAWEALGALPWRQHLALFLKDVEGHSYREIAHILETSESAVETLMFRARRNFARAYERLEACRADRCDQAARLMVLAVDGEATAVQKRGLRAHLDGCRTCADDLGRVRRARLAYAALPLLPVPKLLWGRVLDGALSGSAATTASAAGSGAAASVGAAGAPGMAQVVALAAAKAKLLALTIAVTAGVTAGGLAIQESQQPPGRPAAVAQEAAMAEQPPLEVRQEDAQAPGSAGVAEGSRGPVSAQASRLVQLETPALAGGQGPATIAVSAGLGHQEAMSAQVTLVLPLVSPSGDLIGEAPAIHSDTAANIFEHFAGIGLPTTSATEPPAGVPTQVEAFTPPTVSPFPPLEPTAPQQTEGLQTTPATADQITSVDAAPDPVAVEQLVPANASPLLVAPSLQVPLPLGVP